MFPFTPLELRFLGQARNGMAGIDERTWLSMPTHIRQRIAEHRAERMGGEFAEFRMLLRQGAAASVAARTEMLSTDVVVNKLFTEF